MSRALDYRTAVEDFYNGVARRMAERMEVTEQWLSRFLELAKLPSVIVEAFGDIREIRENHARIVKPLLNDDQARPKVMAAAKLLSSEQAARVKAGEPVIDRGAGDRAPENGWGREGGGAPRERRPEDPFVRSRRPIVQPDPERRQARDDRAVARRQRHQ